MKKQRFIHVTNWILAFSIPAILLTVDVNTSMINSSVDTKNLNTSLFEKIVEVKEEKVIEPVQETVEVEKDNIENKKIITESKEEVVEQKQEVQTEETPVVEEEQVKQPVEIPKEETKTDVIETFSGNLSYYRANCSGCSGFTATGFDVRDGKLFYNDPTYGNVRIIASGKEIPKYSIVRIKNSSLGNDVLAIVLDRGGDIGQGRKFIVDVLTNSTEARGGVDYGVSIEVIRKGR